MPEPKLISFQEGYLRHIALLLVLGTAAFASLVPAAAAGEAMYFRWDGGVPRAAGSLPSD